MSGKRDLRGTKWETHYFWRKDLNEPHNPRDGCWCAVCSGFMCGCPCHKSSMFKETVDSPVVE